MKPVLLTLCAMLLTVAVGAQQQRERNLFNLDRGLGIQGYDPVAYFVDNRAVEGSAALATTYLGVTYRFSSRRNKELFDASPARYEPEFGGWCAYAMGASGEKVGIDPETFKVTGGKLYLFYNAYFNNTLTKWNKDETNLLGKARSNWQRLISSPAK